MKMLSIPQLYRNIRRWTEILTVLSRYGLADWISRSNVDFVKNQLKDRDGHALARHTQETRIRMALTDLGPTFIKFGQLMATRPDLVGADLANELRKLQRDAPADPFDRVKSLVESELGQPLEELFLEFAEQPFASASIGQVHMARLQSGEPVVVKVQHHGIEQVVRRDLDVLAGLAQLAERLPELATYRPRTTVAELSRTMRRELDFGREERNLIQFNAQYDDGLHVRIPRPHSDLCTPRVLTMEVIEGVKLDDVEQVRAHDMDLDAIARRGAELYMEMIFGQGFFHADPHPGNVLLVPDSGIALVDFGMVGRLDERLREAVEEMLMAIIQQDVVMLTTTIKRIGKMPAGMDEGNLSVELAEFIGVHATKPLEELNLSNALNDMIDIIRRFEITLPSQAALLIKTLITLDGTTRLLSPRFSLLEVLAPYHRKLMRRRLSPRRQMRKMRRLYVQLEHLAESLPQRMMDILEQIRAGKFDVHLDHRGLSPSVNRLVLGLLASALFLGSSQMLASQVPPLLFAEQPVLGISKLSLLGLTGCTISILISLRLLRAIVKSGHLDRQEK